jgi:demethylsterigmatocystin 6-O-methyltransferase
MRAQRDGLPTWIDGYPVFEKTKDLKPDQPLFVDIGGSVGHESLRLRDRYPNIPGTVTVQDLPVAIDGLPAEHRRSNVDFMTHDFFNPQPIKGE